VLPLGHRLAVERTTGERLLSSGIILPAPDMLYSRVGVVTAAGRGTREIVPGDRILYSSRADTFVLDDGKTVDIVEENSVIGLL
jgi:co-chaperonin GroES (HSP10)